MKTDTAASWNIVIADSDKFSRRMADLRRRMMLIREHSAGDARLMQIIDSVDRIAGRIQSFFGGVHTLMTGDATHDRERFVAAYFRRNYSVLSEYTKAAISVLKYALDTPEWLEQQGNPLANILQRLHAQTMRLKLECEEAFRRRYSADFSFDEEFEPRQWTARKREQQEAQQRHDALEELGLQDDATQHDIKVAFRRKAKMLHPDLNRADSEAFYRLNNAYELLRGRGA